MKFRINNQEIEVQSFKMNKKPEDIITILEGSFDPIDSIDVLHNRGNDAGKLFGFSLPEGSELDICPGYKFKVTFDNEEYHTLTFVRRDVNTNILYFQADTFASATKIYKGFGLFKS